MPNFIGPADNLIYGGAIIPRGQMVHASGKELERLKALGHQFEGHEQVSGPLTVETPPAPALAIGANGGPITTSEVLASSGEHIAAQREAAVQAAEQQSAADEAADRPEVRQSGARSNR